MEKYLQQLLEDIAFATENISIPYEKETLELEDWLPPEEEEAIAPVRDLEEWTGIQKDFLPPPDTLTDDQVHRLVEALIKLLDACNWSFVLQFSTPERFQYAAIRDNFRQQVKILRWHYGFFEVCREGTPHGQCALGEYCQCKLLSDFFCGNE